jgi:muconolactone delta-isomerase
MIEMNYDWRRMGQFSGYGLFHGTRKKEEIHRKAQPHLQA